ncbi:MAG: formyl transferase [Pseudomonadota bacterium]
MQRTERTGRLVLLLAETPLAAIVANTFLSKFPEAVILREAPEPKSDVLKRRRRLMGTTAALSQAAAGLLVRARRRGHRRRIDEICRIHDFDADWLSVAERASDVRDVASVNSDACVSALREIDPECVVVYGTRLLGTALLGAIEAPFINYHAGLTPMYRGQHPGYWALAYGDAAHAGVTVHLIDRGVDTGDVLAQARVPLHRRRDTLATFQWVQMAYGLPLLVAAAEQALRGKLTPRKAPTALPSANHLPPRLGTYVANGLRAGVW